MISLSTLLFSTCYANMGQRQCGSTTPCFFQLLPNCLYGRWYFIFKVAFRNVRLVCFKFQISMQMLRIYNYFYWYFYSSHSDNLMWASHFLILKTALSSDSYLTSFATELIIVDVSCSLPLLSTFLIKIWKILSFMAALESRTSSYIVQNELRFCGHSDFFIRVENF